MTEVYSTLPATSNWQDVESRARLVDVATWCERHGCIGALVYTDNSILDPWVVSQFVIENTSRFVPLIATQAAYIHPYHAARQIRSLNRIYDRAVHLNLVSGGFVGHLQQIGSLLSHEERYEQLIEFGAIVGGLLAEAKSVTFQGKYFSVSRARLPEDAESSFANRLFLSGSSSDSERAARSLNVLRLSYPLPPEHSSEGDLHPRGIRIGLIARETEELAWEAARERFPSNRSAEKLQDYLASTTESSWYRSLSDFDESTMGAATYWLYPFRSYKTFCPYLVGSFEQVSGTLEAYLRSGVTTIVLDEPQNEEDIASAMKSIAMATSRV